MEKIIIDVKNKTQTIKTVEPVVNMEEFSNLEKKRTINIKLKRLEELRKDIVQDIAGLVVEDIDERKKEYRTLLNEVRELQGKKPRKNKSSISVMD